MTTRQARSLTRLIRHAIMTAGLTVAVVPALALAATGTTDQEAQARSQWHERMAHTAVPEEGCYHATYPEVTWQSVTCREGAVAAHPVHAQRARPAVQPGAQVVGNGNDFAAYSFGLIGYAGGSFVTSGVRYEDGVGTPTFDYGGELGPNEYTVQLNTNDNETTAACAGHRDCTVWQQFVYASNYVGEGAKAFIQYWLLNWDAVCPAGWNQSGGSCYRNSAYVYLPDIPISELGEIRLSGDVLPGGYDILTFTYGTESWSVFARDSVLNIGTVWHSAEFNVVGNGGGSEALFNPGSVVTVSLRLIDGSTSAPLCQRSAGTTGETNNLSLGACFAYSGTPRIQFTETH